MPYRLLLVDDDKDFRSELKEMLEDEYDVVEASGGQNAVNKIKDSNIIDLIILDIRLPDMTGTEVLKKIKEINPDIFVIMLTGYGDRDNILESLRGHADDYLEKPVKADKLLHSIGKLLAEKNENAGTVIDKLKYFIEKNYHKEINLKDASRIVYLSPKYVSRIFKDKAGMGFNEYKLNLRIKKARELLDETDLTINEISYKIGYQNVESFVRIFKKHHNCTPSNYRYRENK